MYNDFIYFAQAAGDDFLFEEEIIVGVICPECGEVIYFVDWNDKCDWSECPVCGFNPFEE